MSDEYEVVIFPVPLGNGRVAQIKIPCDLTRQEAEKISRVVAAFGYLSFTEAEEIAAK